MLDPIADKGLVLSALITLSLTMWSPEHQFPLWFPVLVISKDVLSFGGAWLIHYCVGRVIIRPHWTGKVSTVTLMVALAWVMLRLDWLPLIAPVVVASVFVVASGIAYIVDCAVQIREGSAAADAAAAEVSMAGQASGSVPDGDRSHRFL
jgi:CDP-diacylglycerol--glycerol-3-phosphate 3-phosphatidyltransferase/cardiolipin synthase